MDLRHCSVKHAVVHKAETDIRGFFQPVEIRIALIEPDRQDPVCAEFISVIYRIGPSLIYNIDHGPAALLRQDLHPLRHLIGQDRPVCKLMFRSLRERNNDCVLFSCFNLILSFFVLDCPGDQHFGNKIRKVIRLPRIRALHGDRRRGLLAVVQGVILHALRQNCAVRFFLSVHGIHGAVDREGAGGEFHGIPVVSCFRRVKIHHFRAVFAEVDHVHLAVILRGILLLIGDDDLHIALGLDLVSVAVTDRDVKETRPGDALFISSRVLSDRAGGLRRKSFIFRRSERDLIGADPGIRREHSLIVADHGDLRVAHADGKIRLHKSAFCRSLSPRELKGSIAPLVRVSLSILHRGSVVSSDPGRQSEISPDSLFVLVIRAVCIRKIIDHLAVQDLDKSAVIFFRHDPLLRIGRGSIRLGNIRVA